MESPRTKKPLFVSILLMNNNALFRSKKNTLTMIAVRVCVIS